jgi:hypothetical protein
MMDNYEAAMDAARLGWYLTTGVGDELIAMNPTRREEMWVFSEGKWTRNEEEREQLSPCEHDLTNLGDEDGDQ